MFARIDVEQNPVLEEFFSIDGYPSLILFRDGAKEKEYAGTHTAAFMASYLERELAPHSHHIASVPHMGRFLRGTTSEVLLVTRADSEAEARSSASHAIAEMRDAAHDHITFAFFPTHELQRLQAAPPPQDDTAGETGTPADDFARVVLLDIPCLSSQDAILADEVSSCFAGGGHGTCCLSGVGA